MGVIIRNKEKSIDCTFTGVSKCKSQIAENISPIFRDWFDKFLNPNYVPTKEDDRMCEYYQQLYSISDDMMEFLFECTGETIPNKLVKQIAKLINKDSEDFCIGYIGHKDYATYQQFKDIILTAANNRWVVRFY